MILCIQGDKLIYFLAARYTLLLYVIISKNRYAVSAVRLLIIPLMTTLLAAVMPFGDFAFKLTAIIFAAAPAGSDIAVYTQIYGGNYKAAAGEVVHSTLLPVITILLIIQIAENILQNNFL